MPALKNYVTSQGVKFTNMTSTFPLCCPGRGHHPARAIRAQHPYPGQGTQRPRDADSGMSNAALKFLDDRLDSPKPVFAFVNFTGTTP
jgi:hypothetical protein